jgi:predicted GIY-YIG superfamily endonuclease
MQIVYALWWETTSSIYIGKTNSLATRIARHLQKLSMSTHTNKKLQEQYNKYGSPEVVSLEVCEDSKVFEVERSWIKEFDSVNTGLNLIGDLSTNKVSENTQPLDIYVDASIKCKYVLIGPDSTVYYVDNMIEFCKTAPDLKDNFLAEANQLNKVCRGDRSKSHKGYRLYRGPETYVPKKKNTYTIQGDGQTFYGVNNIAKFCKEHPMLCEDWENIANGLRAVASGRRKSYKGFTAQIEKGDSV